MDNHPNICDEFAVMGAAMFVASGPSVESSFRWWCSCCRGGTYKKKKKVGVDLGNYAIKMAWVTVNLSGCFLVCYSDLVTINVQDGFHGPSHRRHCRKGPDKHRQSQHVLDASQWPTVDLSRSEIRHAINSYCMFQAMWVYYARV